MFTQHVCGTYEASYTYIHELTYYMHDTYIHT
jgi:hypothetical protein